MNKAANRNLENSIEKRLGIRVYKEFSKDEKFFGVFICITGIIYSIFEEFGIRIVSPKVAMIILALCSAYLCFNRVIKLLIYIAKNKFDFYDTFFTVEDIVHIAFGRSGYDAYIVNYNDADNRSHTKEIHSSFSVKKWKIGDKIKIKVSKNNSDTILIIFSDIALAIIMSIMGIIFEVILITVYLHIQ